MIEIDPSELGPDDFLLSGRLQLDTAIAVLAMTGVNPRAEAALRAVQNVHEAERDPGRQSDLRIFLHGEEAGRFKTDIVASALLAEKNPDLPQAERIAAGGLAAILGGQRGTDTA